MAADAVLADTAAVMAFAWVVIIGLSLASADSGLRWTGVGWVAWTALIAAWAVCLVLRVLAVPVMVCVAAVTTVAAALATAPTAWLGANPVVAPWIDMSMILAGLLLRGRYVALAIGVTAGGAVAAMGIGAVMSAPPDPAFWRGALLIVVSGSVFGFAASGVVRALLHVAKADDDASGEYDRAVAVEHADSARRAEAIRVSATIHDGVLNTLGAIARGAGARSPERVAARCRADVGRLGPLLGGRAEGDGATLSAGAIPELVAAAKLRADLLDLRLTVDAGCSWPLLPADVSGAARAVVEESLTNVSKHAGSRAAVLTIRGGADWLEVELRDHGAGFDHTAVGNPKWMSRRCAAAGLDLAVESFPGYGTTVRVGWRQPADGAVPPEDSGPEPSLWISARVPMLRWLSLWLIGLFAFQTAITWGMAPAVGNLAALAVVSVAGVVAVRNAQLRDRASPVVVAYLVIAAGAVGYLSAWGGTGCARIAVSWWGGLAGLLCILLLIFVAGGRGVALGVASLAAGTILVAMDVMNTSPTGMETACVVESLPTMFVTEVAIAWAVFRFRGLTVRRGAQAEHRRAEARRAHARTVRAQARDQVRRSHTEAALATALPLVTDIGEGRSDPADPDVVGACAAEESFLRSLVVIDPGLGRLGELLADAVRSGRSHGIEVHVESGGPVAIPGPPELHAIEVVIRGLLSDLAPGSALAVTSFPSDSGAALSLVSESGNLTSDRWRTVLQLPRGTLEVRDDSDSEEILIEMSWGQAEDPSADEVEGSA